MTGLSLELIGTIRTRHTKLEHTPVQAGLNLDDRGTIELEARYVDGLEGLDGFTHAWLLTWLADGHGPRPEPALRQVPYLLGRQPREIGILATRGPRRPNPLGLSLVRLVAVDGATIHFAGVDMADGTPLIDLKPYVARFDQPVGEIRCGWFDGVTFDGRITPATLGSSSHDGS